MQEVQSPFAASRCAMTEEKIMEKLKMAIIGSGQIAQVTHIPNYQSMEEVKIVGISDTRLEAAKSVAEKFQIENYYDSHKKMLEECRPDAVTVCVPNKFHSSITMDALEAGCHVFCEKPPAITAQEARNMEEKAKEKNLFLSYGFHFRASEQVAFLKKAIESGQMGKIYHADVQWHRRRGIPGWGSFTNKEIQGGGPLIDIGAHMLDSALYLMGYPKVSYVCATYSDRLGKSSKAGLMGSWDTERFTVEDSLFGFVRFADGTSLNLQTSFAINRAEKDVRSVKLYGSCQGADLFPLRVFGEENGQLYDKDYPFMEMRDWHLDLDRNFVKACLGEESLLVTARQGTYIQELICMLYQSAESGEPVMSREGI